jgi:hypothetical protein
MGKLGVADPMTDPRVLVLSWKMDAETMNVYYKDEFVTALAKLGATSLDGISQAVGEAFATVQHGPVKNPDDPKDSTTFKDFYAYCFRYAKDSGMRSLAKEYAVAIWRLVLPIREEFEMTEEFVSFIEEKFKEKYITRDQWMMTLEFFLSVKSDLAAYDDGLYPYMIDEFVEWRRQQQQTCGPTSQGSGGVGGQGGAGMDVDDESDY